MTARFRLLDLLTHRGMSQAELARASGVAPRTIARLCHNETATVALATLDRLALALNLEPGELIARDPAPKRRARPRRS